MSYYVRMRRNGRAVGTIGPFRSHATAASQARVIADDAAPDVRVSVEKPRRANGRSHATMKKLGKRFKQTALESRIPRPVRRPMLAFAFALMDSKVPLADKYLAVGGTAPMAALDGPLPLADLTAAGLTLYKMSKLAQPRHFAQADKTLARGEST
jgi:hypothetical protein